jgi:predicted ATPase
LQSGQVDAGLTIVAEALDMVDRTGERFYEAELVRLRAELLLAGAADRVQEAEAGFRRAIALPRGQQARLLELRAAISLHRLGRQQGRGDATRRELAVVYDSFDEGYDAPDLMDAQALLALGASDAQPLPCTGYGR